MFYIGIRSASLATCLSSMGVVWYGSRPVWELSGMGVVQYGSLLVWESSGMGVVRYGSHPVWESSGRPVWESYNRVLCPVWGLVSTGRPVGGD